MNTSISQMSFSVSQPHDAILRGHLNYLPFMVLQQEIEKMKAYRIEDLTTELNDDT